MRTLRFGIPLLLFGAAGCNLWPGGLGRVTLPHDVASTRRLDQLSLDSRTTEGPQTVEEGIEAIRKRVDADTQATQEKEPQGAESNEQETKEKERAEQAEAPKTATEQKTATDQKGAAKPISLDGTMLPMTVAEMRALVLRNNLDLDVALYDPEIARKRVSAEEGRFDALIGSRFGYRRTETPRLDGPLVDLTSGNPALQKQVVKLTELQQLREKLGFGVGVKVPLPTGGQVAVEGLFDEKSIVDPQRFDQYLAATRFSISQPLLRNAGSNAALARIRLARVDQGITEVRTKLAALRVLSKAEKAYWRLYAARRFFDVRAEQYRLASEGLELVRRRVAEGLSPRVEIVRAEVGVYKRLETLVVAETEWRLRQRDLKRFLASERFPLRGGDMVDVKTPPRLAGLKLDTVALLKHALQARPELIEMELRLLRAGIDVDFRRNQVLPIVNLDFQYGTLARDENFGAAWASQWDFDNQDLFVGMKVELPLTNQRRKAELGRSLLLRSRTLATREARELAVREEVLDVIDIMDRNWQRIIASRQNVIVAGVNYDAERRQFEEGMRTMREVLEALSDLGDAQLREIRAIVDYQVSQIDLAFATGTLLGYARVGLDALRIPRPNMDGIQ